MLDIPTPQHSDGTYYDPEDEDDVPTASEPPVSQPPYEELSSGLRAEVARAGLPEGCHIAAERGGIGLATLRILLPDGSPVIVIRDRYTHPIRFRASSRDGIGARITVEDVPGTTSAALIDPDLPYGFGRGYPLQANGVAVVTAEGWTTSWTAPATLSQATLRAWAFAGAGASSAATG